MKTIAATTDTRRPAAFVFATLVVLATLACTMPAVSAAYEPTGSPIISIGDTFVIYSPYHQSFCYWESYDPFMINNREQIKCNVGKNDLWQATRFKMTAPYAHHVCGRVPMSPYNIPVSFGTGTHTCWTGVHFYGCSIITITGGSRILNCGDDQGPVQGSFLLANTAAPPNGADGWLHGGETPISIRSVATGTGCGVDSDLGRVVCPGPGPAAASVFHFIPVDPVPDPVC
ncbi:hypothetical protein pmac_cds_917 [Pandoravirus macleodensis]|uniref:Uncharacterized protein n=1 Tax=Pandoravirus macleodensis TaxID=2107707 RepID=A0A2U7UGQ8_9VIRU|nr:hypothetical protein pmac_cds_917 [Pandoravirus macleodensis]AVK77605.1 hypothetical protein pmac_cds_917 [Pandoravirus macleodensis]UMO80428.1 hypothetical protein [Pandoravirus aubagnensis]